MDNSILICIFNYRHNDNAKRWLSILSPYFDTYVLDSGNNVVIEEFIQFPNIYYSGLFNEAKKLSERKTYEWIGIIPSDITASDENIDKLLNKIHWLKFTENIGIYQPSLDYTSRNWIGNIQTNKFKYESKKIIEANIFFIKGCILSKYPFIDTNVNKYGYGVSEGISFLSTSLKYLNIFDNTLSVHHPDAVGYPADEASKQGRVYLEDLCKKFKFNIDDMYNTRHNSLGEGYIKFKKSILLSKDNYFLLKNDLIWKICEEDGHDYIEQFTSNTERYIITLTSWPKRINYVETVLKSILTAYVKPDKIVINLSSEEFPNKENDLPNKLKELMSSYKIIEINWLKNNTKVWKKILPTLVKYPNDCIIGIDDDFLYPMDFLKTFKESHEKSPNQPIFGTRVFCWNKVMQHCGTGSLDKLEWFGKYLNILDDECLNYIGDDDYYTLCYFANKKQPISTPKRYHTNMKALTNADSFSADNPNLKEQIRTQHLTDIAIKHKLIVKKEITTNFGGIHDIIGCRPIKTEPTPSTTTIVPHVIKRIFY